MVSGIIEIATQVMKNASLCQKIAQSIAQIHKNASKFKKIKNQILSKALCIFL
jgi:hypothetical protein